MGQGSAWTSLKIIAQQHMRICPANGLVALSAQGLQNPLGLQSPPRPESMEEAMEQHPPQSLPLAPGSALPTRTM